MIHLRRIEPGTAPGNLYVRVCTLSGSLLTQYALDDVAQAENTGTSDLTMTDTWLDVHPDDVVYLYIYDGDTGDCVKTIVVDRP